MSFDALLGNEQLKSNLTRSIRRGHISHFYLLSGPKGSGKHTLAGLLSAALMCRGENAPCLSCPSCRKVLAHTHPDVITVDDPEKKTVSVSLVREAKSQIYIRPNEGDKKIYIFPRAQDMGLEAQNALLKVLEEPPEYGVFLLLTDNPQKLLPTVRSRCTELKLLPLPESTLISALEKRFPEKSPEDIRGAVSRSGGYLGQAAEAFDREPAPQTQALFKAMGSRDVFGLLQTLVPLERAKRDGLIELVSEWQTVSQEALRCKCGGQALSASARVLAESRTAPELLAVVKILGQALDYLNANVSPAAVCGWLSWELR